MACCADGLIGWKDPGTQPICEDREIRLAMSDYRRAESQTVSSAPDSPTERTEEERKCWSQTVDIVQWERNYELKVEING